MRRFVEFFNVVKSERGKVGLIEGLLIAFKIALNLMPYWYFPKSFEKLEWKRRYRACMKCPIFDPNLKKCRPYKGSNAGCGCYVPFSNIVYDECWGRKNYGKIIGWSANDPESWLVRVRDGQGNSSRRGAVEKRDWTI